MAAPLALIGTILYELFNVTADLAAKTLELAPNIPAFAFIFVIATNFMAYFDVSTMDKLYTSNSPNFILYMLGGTVGFYGDLLTPVTVQDVPGVVTTVLGSELADVLVMVIYITKLSLLLWTAYYAVTFYWMYLGVTKSTGTGKMTYKG